MKSKIIKRKIYIKQNSIKKKTFFNAEKKKNSIHTTSDNQNIHCNIDATQYNGSFSQQHLRSS